MDSSLKAPTLWRWNHVHDLTCFWALTSVNYFVIPIWKPCLYELPIIFPWGTQALISCIWDYSRRNLRSTPCSLICSIIGWHSMWSPDERAQQLWELGSVLIADAAHWWHRHGPRKWFCQAGLAASTTVWSLPLVSNWSFWVRTEPAASHLCSDLYFAGLPLSNRPSIAIHSPIPIHQPSPCMTTTRARPRFRRESRRSSCGSGCPLHHLLHANVHQAGLGRLPDQNKTLWWQKRRRGVCSVLADPSGVH